MKYQRASLLLIAVLIMSGLVLATRGDSAVNEVSPAEQQLIDLLADYYAELEVYWDLGRQYKTKEQRQTAVVSGEYRNPNADYIPRLLAFEELHRGEDVGLNALHRVFSEASRGGWTHDPRHVGARQAAKRLAVYADNPLLPRVVDRACNVTAEPVVAKAMHGLLELADLPEKSRDVIRYRLASQALEVGRLVTAFEKRLDRLRSGEAEASWPEELSYYESMLERLPSVVEAEVATTLALETLEELAANPQSPRMPGLEGVDERWRVVRVIDDPEMPLLSERAAALLFKHRHLVVGAEAPNLEVNLLGGGVWRMADQRGKVVVVQFCFTGCGPCERMYPGMAEIVAEHGDAVSLLTIMRDETPEAAQQKIDNGKFTWNIAHDGKPGRVTTAWSVDGFPTVYVINQQGRIDSEGLRGEDLSERVDELLTGD